MTLPKQKANESDADYATRLEKAKEKKKERERKHYEANREKMKERKRKYREANREKMSKYYSEYRKANGEKQREAQRKYREKKVLASAKGKPLRNDCLRPRRPKMLTELILKHAEGFCLKYGFPLGQMLDTDILVCAARTIRDSLELNGTENPWYRSDYLHESLITNGYWGETLRRNWRNKI